MNDMNDASMKTFAERHDLWGNPRGLMLLPDTHLNVDKKRGRVLALPLMLMRYPTALSKVAAVGLIRDCVLDVVPLNSFSRVS